MKRTMLVITMLFLAAFARAEVIKVIETSSTIEAFTPGARVYVSDTATKSHDNLTMLLKESGFQIAEREDDADYIFSIYKLQMLMDTAGKKTYIDLYNIDAYSQTVIEPATQEFDLKKEGGDGKTGRVRGMLDTDAGVIAQGTRLTGSTGGGFVVGIIGAAIGGLVDSMVVARANPDDPPLGVVIARGSITKTGAENQTPAKVAIAVKSTGPEKPAALFDEALRSYVNVARTGFIENSSK